MKIILTYSILLLSVFTVNDSVAQDLVDYNEPYNYLYSCEIGTLDSIVNADSDEHLLFISAYKFFWQALIASDFDKFFSLADKEIDKHNFDSDHELDALFELLRIRIALSQKNYWTAYSSSNGLKAYFKQSGISSNEINQLLWGMHHYFVATFRESFIYRSMLIGWPDADQQTGIEILTNLCTNQSTFISTEAIYILGKIYLEIESKPQLALEQFQILVNRYPNNKIYNELLLQSQVNAKKDVSLQHP